MIKKPIDLYGKCAHCGSDWCGGDIPEDIRAHYSPPFKWSRAIGIEDPALYDGTAWFECPDCHYRFAVLPFVQDVPPPDMNNETRANIISNAGNDVRNSPDEILHAGWTVTVVRGDWTATCTGNSAEGCFDSCMEAYDRDKWPDRDRYGSMN